MWGWLDRDISRLAVQTAGIGDCFSANARNSRHKWQKAMLRPRERNTTYNKKMSDASGPGSARKCPGLALADLGDIEGFEKDGEEGQLYGLQLSDWVYKRKKVVTQEGGGAQKLGGLSDMDLSYAAPRRLHTLAFTGSRRVDFAEPVQEMGWLVDVKVSAPYVVMAQQQGSFSGAISRYSHIFLQEIASKFQE